MWFSIWRVLHVLSSSIFGCRPDSVSTTVSDGISGGDHAGVPGGVVGGGLVGVSSSCL